MIGKQFLTFGGITVPHYETLQSYLTHHAFCDLWRSGEKSLGMSLKWGKWIHLMFSPRFLGGVIVSRFASCSGVHSPS